MITLELDFVGMFVVVKETATGFVSIGCLDEPGHVHTMHFWEPQGPGVRIEALRSLTGRSLAFGTLPRAATVIESPHRLRNVALDGGGARTDLAGLTGGEGKERPPLFTRIDLSGGTLTALPALIGEEFSKWRVPEKEPFDLTDRLHYSVELPGEDLPLRLNDQDVVNLRADGQGRVRVVFSALDADFGERGVKFKAGFPLTEYALFYQLTVDYGPVPEACGPVPLAAQARILGNPKRPICPVGYLEV